MLQLEHSIWTLEVCCPAIRTYDLLILAFSPKSCYILAHVQMLRYLLHCE